MLKENVAVGMYINVPKLSANKDMRGVYSVVQTVSALVCDWLQYPTPCPLIETTNRDFCMSFLPLVVI